jgi:hypothetical protein
VRHPWVRLVGVALVVAIGPSACGSSSDGGAETATTLATTTTEPTTTTTSPCLAIRTKAVDLVVAYNLERRGVAGPPDRARYVRSAMAIRDEARAAGCPDPPALAGFLG